MKMNNYKENSQMLGDNTELVHFDDILSNVIEKIEREGKKVEKLIPQDKYDLTKYLKYQKGFVFKKKTSFFKKEMENEIVKKLKRKLEKNYLIEVESDTESEIDPDPFFNEIPEELPVYLKYLLSSSFVKTCPVKDGILVVSKVEIILFGSTFKHWVLLFTEKKQDITAEEFYDSDLIKSCYNWLQGAILEEFPGTFADLTSLKKKIGFFVGEKNSLPLYLRKMKDPTIFLISSVYEEELQQLIKDMILQ